MKPGMLNRICAYPVIISWVIGALVLDAIILIPLFKGLSLSAFLTDRHVVLYLLAALIPSSLLGYFLGMFTCWPLIRIFCSRYNGAPLQLNDRVMILSGAQKGTIAEVYEITRGQGGWELARLDLGQERKGQFTDIFEEYALFKMKTDE